MPNTVAVIPCYNVESYVEKVIKEAIPFCELIILVDDGSTDKTPSILQKLAKELDKLEVISFSSNQGKGNALLEGFKRALKVPFKALVTLDSDGQHQPKDIISLVRLIEKGADLSIGVRDFSEMILVRRIANSFISFLLRRLYPDAPIDTQSGFRAFHKSLIKEIILKGFQGHYEMELDCLLYALKSKKKILSFPIKTIYFDQNKSSHFSAFTDSFRIVKKLWQHSRLP